MLIKSGIGFLTVILFSIIAVPPAHALWWMGYHKPAFKGKVIDAETKEPIEGAVVVVVYHKTSMGIAESYSVTINVKEALTDKNGEFYIPSYTTLIQPLSWENMANFIIFKPGYGNFPVYQRTPSGIKPKDEEIFFSRETGKEGELEMWIDGEKQPELKTIKVTFGVVELPKLKTREEREKALSIPNLPLEFTCYKIKNLVRLLGEEYVNLGYSDYKRWMEDCK